METCDVAVIGVGAMGSATCAELARRGLKVVGIERFDPCHEVGSSGGETRLIRKVYWEHPDYVPLVVRAYENWRTLEQRCGRQVLFETGCIYAGPVGGPLIAGTLRAAEEHALTIDEFDPREARERFPQFAFPEEATILFDEDAGVLLAERAVGALIDEAEAAGADLRFGQPLIDWSVEGDSVRLRTPDGALSAGRVVFTAGAWTGQLLSEVGLPLRVHRQVLTWTEPTSPQQYGIGRYPAWLVEGAADASGAPIEGALYGFPLMPEASGCELSARGLKVGYHFPGRPLDADADPLDCDRRTTELDEAPWRAAFDRVLPGAGPTIAAKVCLYTYSDDEHFIIDQHPEHESVVFACGFSGHGFKFASVIGEALADLAEHGDTPLPVRFLRMRGSGT